MFYPLKVKNLEQTGYVLTLTLLTLVLAQPVHAFQWTNTELQLQYGNLDIPAFVGGGSSDHLISTFQHANGWKYGDNFFFVDVIDSREPGFQDFDIYSELYSNFSLGKITGNQVGARAVSDIGFILGINYADDARVKKYLTGVRFSLDIEGFAFANLDVMVSFDDSAGVYSGGAPKEDNAILIDFNFARPFKIAGSSFSIEGHLEYFGERDNELGGKARSWILAQPQIRWNPNDRISLGIEYQFWMNKLGDGDTDENTIQALLVWKF